VDLRAPATGAARTGTQAHDRALATWVEVSEGDTTYYYMGSMDWVKGVGTSEALQGCFSHVAKGRYRSASLSRNGSACMRRAGVEWDGEGYAEWVLRLLQHRLVAVR
jgi:hypothetical protein